MSLSTAKKRSCPNASNSISSGSNKRQKFNGDDLICPITTELPWDPVMAEDGRMYERSAITQHIKTRQNNGEQLLSPVTNKPMGSRLIPAIQHRNLIESLIDSGVLTDNELTAQWNMQRKLVANKEKLIKSATNGDSDAMYIVGKNYQGGYNSFPKDYVKANEWYLKGHYAGNVQCTGWYGRNLLRGCGFKTKSSKQGYIYLALAAVQGSKFAAFVLGKAFADGDNDSSGGTDDGIPKNPKEAIYWLEKSISTTTTTNNNIDETTTQEQKFESLAISDATIAKQKLTDLRQQLLHVTTLSTSTTI